MNDSQEVAVKLVSADIELAVRAEPQETVPGGSVNVVCTVENRGDVPIFSTFITGESLGQLGTIDYISPGKSQTLERDIEVSEEMEEEISAEGFTRDGASVRDGDVLTVRLIEPVPPTEEPADPEVAEAVPSVTTRTAAEDAEPAETEREEIGLQKEVNESGTISDGAVVEESSGISGLIHRLKGILAKIRLTKGDRRRKATPRRRHPKEGLAKPCLLDLGQPSWNAGGVDGVWDRRSGRHQRHRPDPRRLPPRRCGIRPSRGWCTTRSRHRQYQSRNRGVLLLG